MKKLYILLTLLTLFAFSSITAAAKASTPNDLEVAIRKPDQALNADQGKVVITITNRGKSTLFLPKYSTPLYTPEDHLMTNIFRIIDEAGKPTRFIGRLVHVSPNHPNDFYGEINPGQTLSKEINLAMDYDLSSGGHYKVKYRQYFVRRIEVDSHGQIAGLPEYVESNEADIWVSDNLTTRPMATNAPDPAAQTCNSTQMDTIRNARSNAASWAYKALQHLEGLYHVEQTGQDSYGDPIYAGIIAQDNLYDYWFGPAINNTSGYLSKPKYTDYWKDHDDYVMIKNINAIQLRVGGESYLCGCGNDYSPTTAAWTETGNGNAVHICAYFFELPVADGAYDSQLLTLLHEDSHFVDGWDSATGDYAYGRDQAHQWIQLDRSQAVRNADNIMYFIGAVNQ